MVSKEHRFSGINSLRFVYGRGQTVRGSLFAIKYAHNKRRKTYRVAVVVSKKVHKSAVVRNRIRRRIYEAIREQEHLIHESFDIAVLVYSDQAAQVEFGELTRQITKQLKTAQII